MLTCGNAGGNQAATGAISWTVVKINESPRTLTIPKWTSKTSDRDGRPQPPRGWPAGLTGREGRAMSKQPMTAEQIAEAVAILAETTRKATVADILETLTDFASDYAKQHDDEWMAGFTEAIAVIKANH